MLKCKEVSQLASTDAIADLGFMKRMELRMHLLMCVHCRRYLSQITAIGQGARRLVTGHQADPEQIEKMETCIVDCVCGCDHGSAGDTNGSVGDDGPEGSSPDDHGDERD